MKSLLIMFIRFYQMFISPYLGANCRFYPTCSAYAIDVLQKYGVLKGSFLAMKRLLRCQPFCKGGYDPVR